MSHASSNHYQGPPAASYSSTHSNSHVANYNGAYGRDGAPSSKFMRPIETAYAPATPHRQNIAPAEGTIPQSRFIGGAVDYLSPRGSPSPSPGYTRSRSPAPVYPRNYTPPPAPPPMYQDAQGQYHHYGEDEKLLAPRPVFVEPKTKRVDASGAALVYGKGVDNDGRMQEKSTSSIRDDPDGEDVWRRLGRESNENPESTWLSRQSAAGSNFKSGTWVVAVIVLGVIALAVVYAVIHHSPPTAPSALSWANGAAEVPSFGVNSTASATNHSGSNAAKTSQSLSARSSLHRFRARNHHTISEPEHELN